MKKELLTFFYFILFFYPVLAQETYHIVEYINLKPEINLFTEYTDDNNVYERILLFHFLRSSQPILIYDTSTKSIGILPDDQIGIDKNELIPQCFWDPHIRKNYIYRRAPGVNNENSGWYALRFTNNFLSFHLQDRNINWTRQNPPYVQLTGTRLFTAQYNVIRFGNTSSWKSIFRVYDINSNKTLWEDTEVGAYEFAEIYWINENWYIKKSTPSFVSGDHPRHNEIYNYETGKSVSFASEIIIGYGKGVILTTTETAGTDFIGITVWTPEKEILYRDSTFPISGIVNRTELSSFGDPAIDVSYFDFPFIYFDISWVTYFGRPYATLILNLIDGKTYISPQGTYLVGIFEAE